MLKLGKYVAYGLLVQLGAGEYFLIEYEYCCLENCSHSLWNMNITLFMWTSM